MGLALFKRCGPRSGIADKAHHDPVEIGQAGLPVIRVPIQPDKLAAPPFNELERARTHRRIGILMRADIALAEDMLRQDRRFVAGQRGHHIGCRPVQAKHGGLGVWRFDRRDFGEGIDPARMNFLQHFHEGVLNISAREGLAVMELHAGAQPEGHRLAVSRNVP